MINIANNLKVTHNLQSISSGTCKGELENAINKLYDKQLSYRIQVFFVSLHISYRCVRYMNIKLLYEYISQLQHACLFEYMINIVFLSQT